MTQVATRWAGLVGKWKFQAGAATFQGAEENRPQAGLAVCNLLFREGLLRAKVTLPDPTSSGRLVFGQDAARTSRYTIGIGGEAFAYYLDETGPQAVTASLKSEREGAASPIPLASWGDPASLPSGEHELLVNLRGQTLHFFVDEVLIFGIDLPRRLAGEQVGAIAWGKKGVRFSRVEVEGANPTVFVVTAFESPYDEVYVEAIAPVCEALGLDPVRADQFSHPGIIHQDIVEALRGATAVIAEITPVNANVFYEVGYAHAIEKPTILLAQKGTTLPFDVSGFRVIFYDDTIAGKPAVERELRLHLQSILGTPI